MLESLFNKVKSPSLVAVFGTLKPFSFFCLGLHNDRLKYCAQRRIQKLVRHLRLSFFFRKLVNEQKRQPSEVFCRKK